MAMAAEDDPERLPYRGFHRYDENDARVSRP